MSRLRFLAPLAPLFVVACSAPPHATLPVDPLIGPPATPVVDEAAPEPPPAEAHPLTDKYGAVAQQIIDATLAKNGAWDKLAYLTDRIGHRLSGSPALEQAVVWAVDTLKADGHENVRAEPVKVPHWVRGAESAELVAPVKRSLRVLGLGLSVGTAKGGLTAEVVVVTTADELTALGDQVKGKIVLFNNVMPAWTEAEGSHYGDAVTFRSAGPVLAAKQGAVGVLIRSVTARSLRSPHTGMTRYDDKTPRIPAAALATEDADLLARLAARADAANRREPVKVHLTMGAKLLADADSANVVAELRGRELPDEIVVIGGHIDSWDVGQGAHDDGAGIVIAMEALTVLRQLKLQPRRTIRVVLYTNEENGVRGAVGYAKAHAAELTQHVAAIESDSGAFAPWGFSLEEGTPDDRVAYVRELARLLAPLGATKVEVSHSGVDVGVSLGKSGALLMGLGVDGSSYFDYHHSEADTLDKVDPKWLAWDVATMAVMAYLLAEDDSLPSP